MSLKKFFATATLFIVLFTQAGSVLAQNSEAAAAPEPKAIKDCDELSPVFPVILDPETKLSTIDTAKIDLSEPYANQYGLNFRIAFEKARTSYHAYVECVFEKVVEDMLGSSGADTDGIFGANAPNLPEWSKPESACIPEKKLVDSLKNGSPETLLGPLLDTYNLFVDYLRALLVEASDKVEVERGGTIKFEEILSRNETFRLLVENETQYALVALDNAFIGLKSQTFPSAAVKPVHFQCMLKNLEFYRRAMENLRRVITALPAVIEDASIHK